MIPDPSTADAFQYCLIKRPFEGYKWVEDDIYAFPVDKRRQQPDYETFPQPEIPDSCKTYAISTEDLEPEETKPDLPSVWDHQEGGDHYKDFVIEPGYYNEVNKLSPAQANVVKYVSRFETKGGPIDLKKALHYVRILLEENYGIRSEVKYSDE